ncbi:MAG: hypothetical protein IPN47_22090 [Gemmatimonadetes bacterium]|nr:hypothetical protein [Gemmatimonadota bacterium]
MRLVDIAGSPPPSLAGRSTYAGMCTALQCDLTETLLLDANWVWSHAISNTEDIVNFNATQGNDFDAERARRQQRSRARG